VLQQELRALVYPLAQVLLGAARLVPAPRYFPLRLRLVGTLHGPDHCAGSLVCVPGSATGPTCERAWSGAGPHVCCILMCATGARSAAAGGGCGCAGAAVAPAAGDAALVGPVQSASGWWRRQPAPAPASATIDYCVSLLTGIHDSWTMLSSSVHWSRQPRGNCQTCRRRCASASRRCARLPFRKRS
jgi:Noc2p family